MRSTLPSSLAAFQLPEKNEALRVQMAACLEKAAVIANLPVDTNNLAIASRDDILVGITPIRRHREDMDVMVYWSTPTSAISTSLPEGEYHVAFQDIESSNPTATFINLDGEKNLTVNAEMARKKMSTDELGSNVGVSVQGLSIQFKVWLGHNAAEHWILNLTIAINTSSGIPA